MKQQSLNQETYNCKDFLTIHKFQENLGTNIFAQTQNKFQPNLVVGQLFRPTLKSRKLIIAKQKLGEKEKNGLKK